MAPRCHRFQWIAGSEIEFHPLRSASRHVIAAPSLSLSLFPCPARTVAVASSHLFVSVTPSITEIKLRLKRVEGRGRSSGGGRQTTHCLPSPPLPSLHSSPSLSPSLSFWSIAVGAAPPPLALSRPGDIKVASCLSLLRAATLQRHRPRRPRSFWEKWLPKIIKREREREREKGTVKRRQYLPV